MVVAILQARIDIGLATVLLFWSRAERDESGILSGLKFGIARASPAHQNSDTTGELLDDKASAQDRGPRYRWPLRP